MLLVDFSNNTSAVINGAAFEKITGYISEIVTEKTKSTKIIAGGRGRLLCLKLSS